MKWKSYLANEHSEQIFLQLNLLLRASTLQNTSSASNVNRKCVKKRQTRAQLAPFLSATSTKQPSSKNLTPLHPGKFVGKVYLQTICLFLTTSLTSLESCTKSCPGTFNFRWNFHKCRLKPGETRLICFTAPCPWTTNCQQLESSNWTKFVTFTVPINSSLKLARFKPSQPLMMSSGTSKWPKTQQNYAIWTHFQGNSADDLADQKVTCEKIYIWTEMAVNVIYWLYIAKGILKIHFPWNKTSLFDGLKRKLSSKDFYSLATQ